MNPLLLAANKTNTSAVKTKMLLHFDGTNGSTTFTDAVNPSRTITKSGTPSLSTTQSKFGGSSFYSATGCLQIPITSDLVCPTTATLEYWFYLTTTGGNPYAFTLGNIANSFLGNAVFALNGQVIYLETSTTYNTWHHVALCSNNGAVKAYLDGNNVWSGNLYNNQYLLGVQGLTLYISSPSNPFESYMDEFRISNVVRYTTNFTPPTQPFTID